MGFVQPALWAKGSNEAGDLEDTARTVYAGYDGLPPPPRHVEPAADQQLELELVVNGMSGGIVAPVIRRNGRFEIHPDDLRRAGLELPEISGDRIVLDRLEGVRADYDAPRQQLHLTVLPAYLPAQRLGRQEREFHAASGDAGALLNYDLYVTGGEGVRAQGSLWHEARAFGPAGVFSTSGAFRSSGDLYRRFDTYWRWSEQATATTIEAGDIITRTLPWAPAIRLGGAQISRDFSVRPDIITYPLPEFAASASLPSTVDLVVNGQRIAGHRVNPGPLAIDVLPPINGYGEANLIVTDMQGRSLATSIPFYVSSALLRPGLTDYSAAVGAFRRNYGLRNFDYGGLAGSASARHGLTDALTLELRAEIADDLKLAGGGAVVKLGNFGIVSTSYSRSFDDGGNGGQLTVGYEYQAPLFSVGARHNRQDSDYTDLGRLEHRQRAGWERSTSASANLSLRSAGTLGIGYFDVRQERGRGARLANASWALPLSNTGRLYTSLSRDFAHHAWSGALTFTLALGGGSLTAGVEQRTNGRLGLRTDYSTPVPSDGGFGWSAGAFSEGGRAPYLRGDVIWRTQPVQLRAGAYGRNRAIGWFGASGSFAFIDNAVFAANRITDAFAVVSTGQADIPVRYENQLIGRTNSDGRLLVPSASAYYAGRFDIDTLSLPANAHVSSVSQRVAISAGSGRIISFPIERMRAARATVIDGTGEFVSAGAVATVNSGQITYVGWDGLLFIEQVAAQNLVEIALPGGGICRVRFSIDPADLAADKVHNLGELTCHD